MILSTNIHLFILKIIREKKKRRGAEKKKKKETERIDKNCQIGTFYLCTEKLKIPKHFNSYVTFSFLHIYLCSYILSYTFLNKNIDILNLLINV